MCHFREIVWSRIGHVAFEVCPDILIRVELRGIAGKELRMEARMSRNELLGDAALVRRILVPHKDDLPRNMTQQIAEKRAHLNTRDIGRVITPVQSQMLPLGTDGNRRNDRDTFSPAAMSQKRCLSTRRPGPANIGNKQTARFIKKYKVGTTFSGLFLYGASGVSSIGQWPLRPFPWPASPASGSSTPTPRETARDDSGGTLSRTASELPPALCEWSTGPCDNPMPGDLAGATSQASSFARRSIWEGDQEPVWDLIHWHPSSDGLSSSDPRNSSRRRLPLPLPRASCPPGAAGWRVGAASLTAEGFQMVSCATV